MDALEHSTTGSFVVATESGSTYIVDFDRQVFKRLPKDADDESLAMRGDYDQVPLLRLVECAVGGRMRLQINLGVPGILFTDRETTMVVAIAKVPPGIDAKGLGAFMRSFGQPRTEEQ